MDSQTAFNVLIGVILMLLGFIGVRLHNKQDEHDKQIKEKLSKEEFDRVLERFETRVERTIDRAVDTIVKAMKE